MSGTLVQDLSALMGIFRTQLGRIVGVAAKCPLTAIGVSRALSIDNKMGWMVHRILTHEDVLDSCQYIPKPIAFEKLIEKCRKKHIHEPLLESLQHTYGQFITMVNRHAMDRASFDLLVASCSGTGSAGAYASQKRAAYHANSHLLGLRAASYFMTWVFVPLTENTFDILSIRGFLRIIHNRPNIPLILAQPRCFHDDGKRRWQGSIEPLDSGVKSDRNSLPYYVRFCSKPLPAVSNIHKEHDRLLYEFESPALGLTGRTDIVLAHLSRNMEGLKRTKENLFREVQMRIRIPVESVQLDLISHRDITSGEDPELSLFGDFLGWDWGTNAIGRNCNTRLPLHTSIRKIDLGTEHSFSTIVPFYTEMLEDAFRRMNIEQSDYICFRSAFDYPVIPSTLNIRHALPSVGGYL